MVAKAQRYVDELSQRMHVIAAAVAGSVARGDFNLWSDIDVVVVADDLPETDRDRARLLMTDASGIEPIGYTPDELRRALSKRDALAVEAVEVGVPLAGAEYLAGLRAARAAGRVPRS